MNKSEKQIQKEILAYAKQHPKIAWIDRANSGKVKVKGGFMQLHENGTPDLIGYSIEGKFIGIEIKDEANFNKKNNGLRPEQITRIAHMEKHGCYIGVAWSINHVDLIVNGFKTYNLN
jgi:hypothetical protein